MKTKLVRVGRALTLGVEEAGFECCLCQNCRVSNGGDDLLFERLYER
jgi:hypothetical protein